RRMDVTEGVYGVPMRLARAIVGLVGLSLATANACSSETGPSSTTMLGVGGAGSTAAQTTTGSGEGGHGGPPSPSAPPSAAGLTCWDGVCANVANDGHHCGMCFKNCPGPHAFCDQGSCDQAPCSMPTGCVAGQFCCGAQCCPFEVLCCDVAGNLECTPPNT